MATVRDCNQGVLFYEPATAGRIASLGLILAGIIGLKLATP